MKSLLNKYAPIYLLLSISVNVYAQINPATDYKDLFNEVQRSKIFNDQKRFLDCSAKYPVNTINQKYNVEKQKEGFDLKKFVGQNFDTTLIDTSSIFKHINYLWSYLTKQPEVNNNFSSLITLPNSFVVPGGRFREAYYWDSYFTMLGLQEAKKYNLIENMINNFSYLISKYGHIPNGNRTYYLSRSQPPFFSLMVDLLAEIKGDSVYIHYLPYLEKEYNYWMLGKEKFGSNDSMTAFNRVVKLGNAKYLNRYWDDLKIPRPESYLIDIKTKEKSGRDSTIYRDIRAAAESGWDFSSRWFTDNSQLINIHTTDLIPVDLNCLLYHLEHCLSIAYNLKSDKTNANKYELLANRRRELVLKYCWDKERKYFYDFDFKNNKISNSMTLAGIFPLYLKLVENKLVIEEVFAKIKNNFLKAGGLVTTTIHSGEQWDSPNGWAPLQWVGYVACLHYSNENLEAKALGKEIAVRWTSLNIKVYFETGKMLEKYNVVDINMPGGGGEYALQDGFGWTNGVFLKMYNDLYRKK